MPTQLRTLVLLLLCYSTALPAVGQETLRLKHPHAQHYGQTVIAQPEQAIVGAPADSLAPGEVYVYHRASTVDAWRKPARLERSGAAPGDGFGAALARDDSLLLVGAPGVRAAFLFRYDGSRGEWRGTRRLDLPDEAGVDETLSVALYGRHAFLGVPDHDGGDGAVYVYRRDDTGTWSFATRLGSDGDAGRFGHALHARDGWLHAGAPAADRVYAFRIETETPTWQQEAVLEPEDGSSGTRFGEVLAGSPRRLLIGAPAFGDRGAAFVFDEVDGSWQQQDRLEGEDAAFGTAVALAADEAAVGAPGAAAYVFTRTPSGWQQQDRLVAPADENGDTFARGVALADSLLLIGYPSADDDEGAAYTYAPSESGWQEQARLSVGREPGTPITGERVDCTDGAAAGYPCRDVHLWSLLPPSALGAPPGVEMNDLWGWTDEATGRRYALIGREDGTAFVDVTEPANPRFLGSLPTHAGTSTWRDIKTFDHYALVVADNAGDHGLQVFDLRRLRNVDNPPVTFDPDAHYGRFQEAHNVVVNEETGFAYAVGLDGPQDVPAGSGCGPGLHMIDLSDPLDPEFAGCFTDEGTGRRGTGYTHDAQCVLYDGPNADYQDREICFGANETALSIADVTDKDEPSPIAQASYPNVAYAHQGWLTEDHRYFLLDDELDEMSDTTLRHTRTLVWDVTDLDDPVLATVYRHDVTSIDHNQYVVGDRAYQANYTSGLRILDVEDPTNPELVAFFDVAPGDDRVVFAGAWSVYPFFEDRDIVLVSSIEGGLFVLQPAIEDDTTTPDRPAPDAFVLGPVRPNPAREEARVTVTNDTDQPVRVVVYDVLGRRVQVVHDGLLPPGAHPFAIDTSDLASGTYVLQANGASASESQVFFIVK